MKKIISVFLLFFLLGFPVTVAAVDFEIDETNITASLQANGQVAVKETHTYSFDGDFNGITRTLIPKKNTAIANVRAAEGDTSLKVEQEDNLYKVYRSGSDETVTVDLFYTIKDGVSVYDDAAEFYWPFFDESNESTYHNMTITIEPPEPTEAKAAYGEDEAYDTAVTNEDGSVTFELGEVPDGENGDIRVAYDPHLFPATPVTSEEPMLETIQSEKEALDEAVAAREEQHARWGTIGAYTTGSLILAGLVLIIQGWRKRQETLREAERQSDGASRFPSVSMSLPAMLAFTNHGHLPTTSLTAALLDLVRKGKVEKVSEKEFKLVDRWTDHEHERRLIEWLFDEIANKETFHVDDLTAYAENKDNHESYQLNYSAWRDTVKNEYLQYDLYKTSEKPRWIAGIAALITLPLVILFPYYEQFGWMAASIALLIFFVGFAIGYRPLTIEGHKIKLALQPLKHGDQWKTWEKEDQVPALLYQIGSGRRDLLSNPNPAVSSSNDDWVLFLLLGTTLHSSFKKADEHASVSAASSVGSGGGGAGVGGGGGGSGAF
ncbi:DUF2207 domain-containing protein [Halobacillus sp. Marseille-P3879]|uniref:DUF2207 domain-containing protein n=1 Tax=Halobacillus sp. Marseille-P3879 TaxID=2045014 RepID=UPI001356B3C9|nr:DUF2207 domain-containing protein [Halobacillus sp. Marseille-P3879]